PRSSDLIRNNYSHIPNAGDILLWVIHFIENTVTYGKGYIRAGIKRFSYTRFRTRGPLRIHSRSARSVICLLTHFLPLKEIDLFCGKLYFEKIISSVSQSKAILVY